MTRTARLLVLAGATLGFLAGVPATALAADPVDARADAPNNVVAVGQTVIDPLVDNPAVGIVGDAPGTASATRPLTISAVGKPSHGTARTDGRTIVYEPAGCYTGIDSFTYTVTDGATSDTATIIFTVPRPSGAPVTDTPVTSLVKGSTISKTTPVRLGWCGAISNGSSLTRYRVYQSTNGGSSFGASPIIDGNGTSSVRNAALGTPYAWRVRTVDTKGTHEAVSPVTRVTRFQDGTSSIAYSAGWKTASSKKYSGGKEHYATRKGATATLTVTGARQFGIVASKGPGRGSFHVFVDGVRVTTSAVSQKKRSSEYRRVLYVGSIPGDTSATHKIRVKTTSKARVNLDAIVVLSARAGQTITFAAPAPTDASYRGAGHDVEAASDAGLPVLLSVPPAAWSFCAIVDGTLSYHGAGTCTITATQFGDVTYDARVASRAFTIAKAPLTITGITAEDRVYAPGGTGAQVDTSAAAIEPGDVFPGDTVTIDDGGVTGTFADANAGTGKTVTVSGLALAGASAPNYAIEPVTTTADILKADQSITFTTEADFRVKDGAAYEVGASAESGLPVTIAVNAASNGVCSISGSTVTFPGFGNCRLDADQAGDANWNAALTTPQVFNVASTGTTPQAITFDPIPGAVTYGAAPQALTATADSGLTVSYAAEPAAVCTVTGGTLAFTGAGTCTVTARQAGNPEYAPAPNASQSVTVARKNLTVTGVTASNKVYDRLTAATLATGSAALVGIIGSDEVLLGTAEATGTFASAGAGNGKTVTVTGLSIDGNKAGSYTLIQPSTTANITKAPLTVTALGQEIMYGDAEPAYTFSYAGFVNGEGPGVLGSTPVCDAATFDGTAGTWPITCSGTAAANYQVTHVAGELTVLRKLVTISFTAANRAYTAGIAAEITGCSVAGIEVGDTTTCSLDDATAWFATSAVGNGKIVTGSGFTLAGADSGNYTITAVNTTTANITRADPSCAIAGYTVTYDGNPHTATGSCVGVIDEPLADPDLTGTTHTNAGSYPDDPWTFTDVSGNYTDDSGTVASVINEATQAISFAELPAKAYGDDAFTVTATAASGLAVAFASQTPSVCSVTGTTVTLLLAGECTIRASQAGNSNYLAAPVQDRSFDVAKAPMTVTADDKSVAYNSAPPAYTFAYGEFIGSDNAGDIATPPTCTSTYETGDAVGTYPITCSGGDDDQYAFTYGAGTLTVNRAGQTITFDALSSREYGDAFTVSAAASSGLTVAFASTTGDVCTVEGTTVTVIDVGPCSIRATQGGDGEFAAAEPVDRAFTATTRAITVTAVTDARTADGTTDSAGTPVLAGGTTLAAGDVGSFTQSFDTPHAGTDKTLTPAATIDKGATDVTDRYAITPLAVSTGIITPDVAASLTLTAVSPQTPGIAFDVTVTAYDEWGNVATGYTGTVELTSDAPDTMPAPHAFTPGAAGVHAFSVTIAAAGSPVFTATDTDTPTITGTSPAILIE